MFKERFSWALLSSEPHRLFFFGGILWFVSAVFWWLTYLGHKYFHWIPTYAFDPKELHATQMLYVVLGTFILGFILTVFPKWLGAEPISRGRYLTLFFLIPVGGIVQFSGTKLGMQTLILGAGMLAAGYMLLFWTLWGIWQKSSMERGQPFYALLAIFGGALGTISYLAYLANPMDYQLYRIAYGLGMYWFLPLLVLSVAFRMIPFFTEARMQTGDMVKLPWALDLWALLLGVKTALFLAELQAWFLVSDGLLLAVTLAQFKAWHFLRRKPEPLLSYLYFGLAWFPLGLLLYMIGGALTLMTDGFYSPFIELAALHAWSLGFFTSMIFAMVTRVSKGHSGRELKAGRFENWIFAFVQLGAISRIFFELMGLIEVTWIFWTFLAGVPLLLGLIPWGWRYLPYYWQLRQDDPKRQEP